MSSVGVAGNSVEVMRRLLLLFCGREATTKSASVDNALENELPAKEALMGEAKGLSGRLCSKLLPFSQKITKQEAKINGETSNTTKQNPGLLPLEINEWQRRANSGFLESSGGITFPGSNHLHCGLDLRLIPPYRRQH